MKKEGKKYENTEKKNMDEEPFIKFQLILFYCIKTDAL